MRDYFQHLTISLDSQWLLNDPETFITPPNLWFKLPLLEWNNQMTLKQFHFHPINYHAYLRLRTQQTTHFHNLLLESNHSSLSCQGKLWLSNADQGQSQCYHTRNWWNDIHSWNIDHPIITVITASYDTSVVCIMRSLTQVIIVWKAVQDTTKKMIWSVDGTC